MLESFDRLFSSVISNRFVFNRAELVREQSNRRYVAAASFA
jgi:hypothetical protein